MDGKSLLLAAIVFTAVLNENRGHRPPCKSDQFRCFNGKCINRSNFCNFHYDCTDESDENYCLYFSHCPIEERTSWFQCVNRIRCIPLEYRCDGSEDCQDGSDETACVQTTTLPTTTDTSTTDFPTTTDFPLLLQKIRNNTINSIIGVDAAIYKMVGSLKAKRDDSRSIAKWGPELPRIAVALFLTDPQFFAPDNETGAELAYELSLQMMVKLALKKKTTTEELALFINALAVSCIDPKDFFGVNMVEELRKRVNNGNYRNPFIYLTLCNAGDSMTPTDVNNVVSTFEVRRRPLWTDVQALATMAMACINSQVDSVVEDTILTNMVKELKTKQHANGTIDSARNTALVMQALLATNSNVDDFDFSGAFKYLLREVANSTLSVQDMYYIIPVLKLVSFVNVSSNHCSTPIKTELEVLKTPQQSLEEHISFRVSMFLGNDIDFARNWQLKVPASYTLYQVLENIGTLEPPYKVRYTTGQDMKPYIVGIHKYFDDPEDEMFWFIFSQMRNATRRTLMEKSPVDIQLKEDEELILWYRNGVWIESP